MPVTKREEVTKQGFCKILGRTLRLQGSLLLVLIQFQFHLIIAQVGGVGVGANWVWLGGGGGGVFAYSRVGAY